MNLDGTPNSASVVGRLLFYNQSAFDGDDPGAGPEDDAAIAPDKQALLPGQVATLANYSSYTWGVNGIMIDLAGSHGAISLDDFQFKVGNDSAPDTWADAPLPTQIVVRPGAGSSGSDRIELIWGNGIVNQWLQVILLATPDTGLAFPDVFYFGNATGDSGNSATDARVNIADQLGARNHATGSATIESLWDYNRDGAVDATDELWARNHATGLHNSLKLIDLSPVITTASAMRSASPSAAAVASALTLSSASVRSSAAEPAPPTLVRRGEAVQALRALDRARQSVFAQSCLAALVSDGLEDVELPDRSPSGEFAPDDDWLKVEGL